MFQLGPKKARSIWAYEDPFKSRWINRYHNDYGTEKWDASRFQINVFIMSYSYV